MNTHDYPQINSTDEIPHVISLKNQIIHAEKYNHKKVNELKERLNNFLKLKFIKP